MIKVLMISTDRKIFEQGTPVHGRMIEYGKLFKELHVVVLSTKEMNLPVQISLSSNTYAYATNSISKFLYIKDGEKLGCKIIHERHFLDKDSVITTQDPFETGHIGRGLSKRSSIPLHVQIHTDFYSAYFKKSLLNKIRVALSHKTLPQAKAIRTVSERIQFSLPKEIRKKSSVLPIFLDITSIKDQRVTVDLKKKYSQFSKIILVASRLTKEKNIDAVLHAFSGILKSRKNTGLVIVGSGVEEAFLKRQVQDMHIGDSVIFESWVDHETLISYMKTCDIFVSSSLYEGYGLSMLEAHSAGAILVATNAGIAPLLVADQMLVNPGDKKGLEVALVEALKGSVINKPYAYPYVSKEAYFEAYKKDIERALL